MPTYQYACTECGHGFDIVQSFSDDSLTVCPECEGRLRKVFNAVGVVFKGSGFYKTDSRSKAAGDSSGPSPESTPSTTKDTTGSGSKSDSTKSGTNGTTGGTKTETAKA